MSYVREPKELSAGVFWVKPADELLFFEIPCNADGAPNVGVSSYVFASKNGKTFNHKRLWDTLGKKDTGNHSYRYYPRGRVEIRNSVAVIFLNPNIHRDEIVDNIKLRFGLTRVNGIQEVKVISDGSEHYTCYLDDDTIE
jgi:hypothetical protein